MVWLSLWETRFHSLTYAEMRLIYARSLYKFDMELAPEAQDWISSTTTSPPPKKKKSSGTSLACRFALGMLLLLLLSLVNDIARNLPRKIWLGRTKQKIRDHCL